MKNYTDGINIKLLSTKAYNVIYKAQGYIPVDDVEDSEEGLDNGKSTTTRNKRKGAKKTQGQD